jgi:prolyl-tRNA synthetase
MKDKAWGSFENSIRSVDSIDEAAEEMSKEGGIITFDWCGDQECGKDIEEKVRVDILGVQESDKENSCINCDKPSKHLTLIAKTY